MAAKMKAIARAPIVVILGATGTGKSKLAIDIARKFNGEIISADSMQVYQGLDIITNKVTAAEQQLCRHHLIGYLSPLCEKHTVIDYRAKALPIIENLIHADKLPIIIGGTNYYIEALLWNFLLETKKNQDTSTTDEQEPLSQSTPDVTTDGCRNQLGKQPPEQQLCSNPSLEETKYSEEPPVENATTSASNKNKSDPKTAAGRDYWKSLSNSELHKCLTEVDLASAQRIHPNDRRKVTRALEVYHDSGRPMSLHLAEQHGEAEDGLSGDLRFRNACVLWIQCDATVLDERTDHRVDSMMEAGLMEEMVEFHRQYNQHRIDNQQEPDYTTGIFQSIGFKEFHPYLMLDAATRDTAEGRKLLAQGMELMKTATRQYARRQHKWIKNRFLKRRGPSVPAVYAVDATETTKWTETTYRPAEAVVEAFLKGETPGQAPIPCEENTNPPVHNVCEVCNGRVFVTAKDWAAHLKGRAHRKALAARRKDGEADDSTGQPVHKLNKAEANVIDTT